MKLGLTILFNFIISIDKFSILVYVIFNWVIFSLSRDDFFGFFKNSVPVDLENISFLTLCFTHARANVCTNKVCINSVCRIIESKLFASIFPVPDSLSVTGNLSRSLVRA